MKPLATIVPLVLLASLAACSDSKTSEPDAKSDTPPPVETNLEPLKISWEQLMPKGEEEKLEELYSAYYAELEKKFQEDAERAGAGESSSEGDPEALDIASIIAEGSSGDTMEQVGTYNVVNELNGKRIRLPGYVVPFDFSSEAEYREFLLVPYFGACLHTPPPPPNQIVFVKAEQAANIENIYDPVWVEGVLKTGRFDSELGNSAYELALESLEKYDY